MATRIEKLWMAVQHVRRARNLLRECGCAPSAETMSKALKSVEGAHRHAKIRDEAERAVRAAMTPISPDYQAVIVPVVFPICQE